MSIYRQRGVALNYAYLNKELFGQVPYIYRIIHPMDWAPTLDDFTFSMSNTLRDYGTLVPMTMFYDSLQQVHLYLKSDYNKITLNVAEPPTEDLLLIAFPKDKAMLHVSDVPFESFTIIDGMFQASIELPLGTNPFLITVNDRYLPAFFNISLNGSTVILRCARRPWFTAQISAYYSKQS
ncbi:hypothetical protein [Acinetobacter sp.]|uniref:hypothetical protein n=1 Tax=Acinetobacter sp. TaxID=472 RepID=UPI003D03681F